MQQKFEELGVIVAGISYGLFTGEAQFDATGQPVVIDIENTFDGTTLRLDIEDLLRERVSLRRRLGVNFLEDGGYEVREHLKKWALFQALSEALVARFLDDISEFLGEDRGADAA